MGTWAREEGEVKKKTQSHGTRLARTLTEVCGDAAMSVNCRVIHIVRMTRNYQVYAWYSSRLQQCVAPP